MQFADAVAATNLYPCPLIIIDMGTATTVSVADGEKSFIGGMIMPGLMVSMEALSNKTSQLPQISLDAPKKAIGRNTADCIKSGLIYGNAAAIDGLIGNIEQELGEKCTVISTGGLAKIVTPLCKRKIIEDDKLLLKGLMIIYEKNSENIPNLYNPQYQVVNNHPAIISAKQFEQVIHEIKRRSNVSYDEYGKAHRKDSKYSSKVKDH